MDAPRALVFRPLVKGNEALGTRLTVLIINIVPWPRLSAYVYTFALAKAAFKTTGRRGRYQIHAGEVFYFNASRLIMLRNLRFSPFADENSAHLVELYLDVDITKFTEENKVQSSED